jgi:4-aminobutyrate aminotransferase-like enzyme
MGWYLGKQLKALQDSHPSVGDVRGLGLFWGLELTRNRKSRLAFNTREDKLQGKSMVADGVAAEYKGHIHQLMDQLPDHSTATDNQEGRNRPRYQRP